MIEGENPNTTTAKIVIAVNEIAFFVLNTQRFKK
jgi:hypothetical protein